MPAARPRGLDAGAALVGCVHMETGTIPLQLFGILLMLLGALVFNLPFLLARMPSLEGAPWLLVYVYRSGSFTFVTSPILIMISLASLLWYLLSGARS